MKANKYLAPKSILLMKIVVILLLKGWILSRERIHNESRDSEEIHSRYFYTISVDSYPLSLPVPDNLMALQTQYLGIDGVNKNNSSKQEMNLSIDMVEESIL